MLTKSEEEIMYLLWDLDEPLTSSEIVKKAVNKTWKKSYINLLINSLFQFCNMANYSYQLMIIC